MPNKIIGAIKNPVRILQFCSRRGWLNWMSDARYLKIVYKARMGKKLDLDAPKTFNEKLQWMKIHNRNSLYSMLVDKYEVRGYVRDRLGEKYLIPLLGVWDKAEKINYNELPKQFVLKCNHDSGSVIVCRDKEKLDIETANRKLNRCLKNNGYGYSREWPYKNVKPRIIAEKYMEDGNTSGLTDYKFYCFNGKPEYLYVSQGLEDHTTAQISFLTTDWEFAPFSRSDYKSFDSLPKKPLGFEEMKVIAAKLSEGHPFLRVDLYQIGNQIYFSELTFTPCGGFMPFDPEEWDRIFGDMIQLPKIVKE